MDSSTTTAVDMTVVSAENLPLTKQSHRLRDSYVELKIGSTPSGCTKTILSTCSPVWNHHFLVDRSNEIDECPISLTVWHVARIRPPRVVGSVHSSLQDLLQHQRAVGNADICLTLHLNGKPVRGNAYICIRVVGMSLAERAEVARGEMLRNRQDILQFRLSKLVEKLVIVKGAVDHVFELNSHAKDAWKFLSASLTLISAQREQDERVLLLVDAILEVYDLMTTVEGLKKIPAVQKVVEQILKQTVVCGEFIRQYVQYEFLERVWRRMTSDIEEKIQSFIQCFRSLKEQFSQGVTVETLLVSFQANDSVQYLYMKGVLKPVFMDTSSRTPCHPESRRLVIHKIADWIFDKSSANKRVFWLQGGARYGKSTVLTSIANIMREFGYLGAFIFFNKDISKQSKPAHVFRTIAFQLAGFDPRIGEEIERATKEHKNIAEAPFEMQFSNLIDKPLNRAAWDFEPIVILIDALDECEDRARLLQVLCEGLAVLPSYLRIVIASRNSEKESDIFGAFDKHALVESYELSCTQYD
ncbi:hypothetical protein EV421DRAFT_132246 [Armillaria borealis]|uniref:C2 domain-containing protein n=1 Tax=Armillaria borealis TaxID=47425 RepID=A0AA39IWQ1_9AGAR|nr:hypothetical protein EV421DRAFT_132246 [Armillaria borealis]